MFFKNIIALTLLFLIADAQFDVEKLASSSNDFCFALMKTSPPNQNVFISPLSIYIALGMVYAGANGYTAAKMERILDFDEDTHRSFGTLLRFLNVASNEYKLEVANALLYQENHYLLPEFRYNLHGYYDALMKEVDLNDVDNALEEVNNWVNEKTHEKIPKLLEELPSDTKLLLLNAVYFKGIWQKRFDPKLTRNSIFYNDGLYEISVPMMNMEDKILTAWLNTKGLKAMALPYKGKHISMLIVMPLTGGKLDEVEESLNADTLKDIVSKLSIAPVKFDVRIPKFELENSRELKKNLTHLGLGNLFGRGADFSGMNGRRNLFISDVLHKAKIEVNEEGSKAAAVTVAEVVEISAVDYPDFYVDHPFLFFIIDLRSNLILFSGRVNRL